MAIPMSDGVTLRADVLLPAGLPGPFPTSLTISGYGRGGIAALGGGSDGLTRHGYAVVTVDDRGTGTSEGKWSSWDQRTLDDYSEVLDWIVAQPWSDGRVGVTGASYMGITSLFTAASGHPAVDAVFAVVPMGDAYRDIVFAGGQMNAAFIPLWMGLVTGLGLVPSGSDPAYLLDHLAALGDFQLPTLIDAGARGETAYDGPFWRQRSPVERAGDITAPTFLVGGLDDLFQRGTPMLYEALAPHTDARLLMGPWTHIGGATGAGLPRDGVPGLSTLLLQWFDAHLKDLDTGAACVPAVTRYVKGAERYETAPSWPVPGLRAERWHLRGGGRLTPDRPGDEGSSTYLQLPITGLCTRSTAQWLIGLLDATPCATDNRLDEALSLTWTTDPFPEAVRVDGPIQADLWLPTALGSDAVTTVAISTVAPDGTSRGMSNGLLLASHRAVDPERSRYLDGESIQPWHPFTQAAARPVPTSVPVQVPVEVFPTSFEVPAGHRLRVTVAAYDVPHALPPLPSVLATLAGPVEVLHTARHPSSVVLPVVAAASAPGVPADRAGSGDGGAAGSGDAGPDQLPATGGGSPVPLLAVLLAIAIAVVSARATAR